MGAKQHDEERDTPVTQRVQGNTGHTAKAKPPPLNIVTVEIDAKMLHSVE